MSIRISFVGDIALNNSYETLKNNNISPFEGVKSSFSDSDYVIGNLESFAEGKNGFNELKRPYLFSPKRTLELLKYLPINLVSFANNHLYDTLKSGYDTTVSILNKLEISYFGAVSQQDPNAFLFKKVIKGKKFSFINACHQDTNPVIPKNSELSFLNYDIEILKKILLQEKKSSDYVIFLFHWGGGGDYGHFPEKYQIDDAKILIDFGASAIVGNHAHCIQPYEIYKDSPIFYCLGNFCFDDIISHKKTNPIRKTGKKGYIAHIDFDYKTTVSIEQVQNKNLLISVIKKSPYYKFVDLQFYFFKKFQFFQKVQNFYLKFIEPKKFYIQMSDKSIFKILITINIVKIKQFLKHRK